MGRAPCCDKANVKKGPWSPEEDAKLKSHIDSHGTGGNWIALPHKIGLKRCGKSCRLRWLNYLRPNIKHGGFTQDEDNLICSLYVTIGSRWSVIAAQLPGRTDNDIKNYWNTRLKKKLLLGSKPPTTPVIVLPSRDQFSIEAGFHDQPVSWTQQQQLGPVGDSVFPGFEETVYQMDGGFSDNMMINPGYHVFHDSSYVAVDGSVNWDDRKMVQADCSWMASLLFDEPPVLGHS